MTKPLNHKTFKERVITVQVRLKTDKGNGDTALTELNSLCHTAGAEVILSLPVYVQKINPALYIGSGKAAQIAGMVKEHNCQTVVFDDELSPAQQRNLEDIIDAKIIDRTRVILDIFAQRANTKEGELQVELAQLNYILPRLTGKGAAMMQQSKGQGLATRGPGEKKLEYDRRKIRQRITNLEKIINHFKTKRQTMRKQRDRLPSAQIALVGYTNVGKSSLLNALTGKNNKQQGVYVDNLLFATLDPTTRRVALPSGGIALFTDTVGFIQKLPHDLIAAFRATLEETANAHCIIIVRDASDPDFENQQKTVVSTIKELKADNVPVLEVFNKADALSPQLRKKLEFKHPNAIFTSAITGAGVKDMLEKAENIIGKTWKPRSLKLKPGSDKIINTIYQIAMVTQNKSLKDGSTSIKFNATDANWQTIVNRVDQKASKTGINFL